MLKIVQQNTMGREKWIERLTAAWNKQVPSIFEVGNLLEAAKAELKHGEWLKMIGDDLPFSKRTAQMLMAVAGNDSLQDANHGSHLPACWRTLYELTKLTAEQFDAGIKSGAINPRMERKDVAVLRGVEPKKKKPAIQDAMHPIDMCSKRVREAVTAAIKDLPREELKGLFAAIEELVKDIKSDVE